MNYQLQKIFSTFYSPDITENKTAGASSIVGTTELRKKIIALFEKYNIKSIFDAGCNDCNWMDLIIPHLDKYYGGDISLAMVAYVWHTYPDFEVEVHDITTDPIPSVDLLFVRDVAIHLNYHDKQKLWNNWFNSGVPWILITHNPDHCENHESDYESGKLLVEQVNWCIKPWNFPAPINTADEYLPGGRCMGLWHQNQFNGIL